MRKLHPYSLRYALLGISTVSCLFIMSVIVLVSTLACKSGQAEAFLATLRRVPVSPYTAMRNTVGICLLLFATFVFRLSVRGRHFSVYATLYIDAAANLMLLRVMDCNYNGFILWLLANIVYYMKSSWKFLVMIAGTLIYMLCSNDIIGLYIPLFNVREYFLFFDHTMQRKLFLLYYTLHDLNFTCFIIFCMAVIRHQKSAIEEIRSLYARLKQANAALREYADIRERMGETRERNRIAMEIHDTIGHALTGISVGVDTCLAIMDVNPAAAKTQLKVISGVAKGGIADIRRSVRTLQEEEDAGTSLDAKLRALLDNARQATGIDIAFSCDALPLCGADEQKAVFRVVQESVTNAIRHGMATKIKVEISQEAGGLLIIVADNGTGCPDFVSGFGTTHMRERLAMLGGSVEFISQKGFTVRAVLPLRKGEQQ